MSLHDASLRNLPLKHMPTDVAVCYHTKDYFSNNGRIVKKSCGIPLPSPVLLVLFCGDAKSIVHVMDLNGEDYGCVDLDVRSDMYRLESLAVCNEHQHIFVADSFNRCVHITHLSGEIVDRLGSNTHKSNSGESLFKHPCGIAVDETSGHHRLVVCDLETDKVFVFSLPQLQLMFSVQNPTIMRPVYASVSLLTGEIWVVNNKLFDPTSVSVIHDGEVKRTVRIHHSQFTFTYPLSLVHDDRGNCYIVDQHRVTQLHDDATEMVSRGSRDKGSGPESLDNPHGICIVKDESKKTVVVVCDSNNRRLKFYTL